MSDLRITDIKPYVIPYIDKAADEDWAFTKAFIFVKVETNAGIHGWGEAYGLADRERSTAMMIEEMRQYVVGWDPYRIKQFTSMAYNMYAERRPSLDLFCAISALEIALWDIVGKHLDTPVYNLLGGPCRDRIRMYANLWSDKSREPDELAEHARGKVAEGFTAVKIYPFMHNADDRLIEERVRKVREAIGDSTDLFIDVGRQQSKNLPIRMARKLEPYNIVWFEEPVPPDNLDVLAEIRRSVRQPVVTGECVFGKRNYREVLSKNAADIFNSNATIVGGILELKEIAAMAEADYVLVGPHNYNSTTIGTSANAHLAAIIPNFLILEYFPNFVELGRQICKNPLEVVDGHIELPKGPGLGLEMKEDILASFTYKEGPNRMYYSHLEKK